MFDARSQPEAFGLVLGCLRLETLPASPTDPFLPLQTPMNESQLTACLFLGCLLLIAVHFSGQSLGRADATNESPEAFAMLPLVFAVIGATIGLIILLVNILIP